ncbi:MAG: hypothetical protein ACYTHJ_16360 [Planctomycetota bacterium]|jgi:hypothetical protein
MILHTILIAILAADYPTPTDHVLAVPRPPPDTRAIAGGLPTQACCFGDVCVDDLDAVECADMGGYPVPDTPLCIPFDPCSLGACCPGIGVCFDNGGDGISLEECGGLPMGEYIGGARCEMEPCPGCDILDEANCQQDTGMFIVEVDRALWNPPNEISRWADDFMPTTTGALDQICWWPGFFDPFDGFCSFQDGIPVGNWLMRIYEDAGSLPGAELGSPQPLDPYSAVAMGDPPRVFLHSALVPEPPMLLADNCYWIEITGEGEGPGGCQAYWALSGDGNDYALRDLNGQYGPEDIETGIEGGTDLSFCLPNGLGGNGCGDIIGACCSSDGTCADDVAIFDCEATGGVIFPATACAAQVCPAACETPPGNGLESCPGAIDLNDPDDPGDCDNGLPCSREFDTRFCGDGSSTEVTNCIITQGGGPQTTQIGSVTWFRYTTPPGSQGEFTISTCGSGTYDGIIVVFGECPNSLNHHLACGDDTCGIASGMGEVRFPNCGCGESYTIAVGGRQADAGTGTLEISFVATPMNVACSCGPGAPLADDRFDVNQSIKPCVTDADCKAGETGPDPQTVCRDTTGDGLPNACYVARQRYLSIKTANPNNVGTPRAYRVSLDTGTAGFAVLGFNGNVDPTPVTGPGVSVFNIARIVDTPVYNTWEDLVPPYMTMGDCEISPGQNYFIQSIAEGDDFNDESNFSSALALPTPQHNGDVTGGGNPGDPPNGATATLADVFSQIKAFQSTQNENKDWLDLEPQVPNMVHSLADAFQGILAFQQNPYPFSAPLDCP